MLQNYFKLALRNIAKYRFFSGINILGMSTGIAACLLILLFVVDELSYDRFHEHADRIYQVTMHARVGGQDMNTSTTCPPMSAALVAEIPGIAQSTRIAPFWGASTFQYGDKVFSEERIFYADSNFFNFFSYKLVEGDLRTALLEPNSVVITEHVATKYFEDGKALGQLVTIGGDQTYKVTGIAQDAPHNSHFIFNVLISSSSAEHLRRPVWLNNFLHTYFLLEEHTPLKSVVNHFNDLVVKYVGPEVERMMGATIEQIRAEGGAFGYFATALTDIHLRSESQHELEPGGNITYIYFFSGIGLFIILIACINFMNLSTARSAGRAKEVGLRKTLGSLRVQMIRQFLTESVLYSFIAVLVALVLCYFLLPYFNLLSAKQLTMEVFTKPVFIVAVVLMIIIIGIIAGSYPAFYLTSFNAVEVLKGKVRAGMKSKGVRSILVVFQFSLSIFLIIFTGVVYQQIEFMQKRNLGIDKHNVMILPAGRMEGNKQAFRNALMQQTGIVSASFTNNNFPGVNSNTVFKLSGSDQDRMSGIYYADYDHQKVMKFEMKEGRFFSKDFPSDSTAIVLNEAAVKEFGFTDPVGQEIISNDRDQNERLHVIGVYKDFNFESLRSNIRPLIIRLGEDGYNLMVRYEGNPADVLAVAEGLWKKYGANEPFDYSFLDQNFDELFRSEQRMGLLFTIFSGLAIFIACLGLFALAAFMAEQRTKEIGIRKVMGASTTGLTLMLSRDFTKLVVVAFVPAALAAWFVVDSWLSGFAYRVDVSPAIFMGSGVIATIIAWVTVSFQSIKAATSNPVNSLRYE